MSENNGTKIIVVDASVVAKWFVQEEETENALLLRNDYLKGKTVIACPDLLGYEVLNALRYKPSFGEKDLNEVASALRKYSFLSYPILNHGLADQAIKVAMKYGLSIYDSSYIAVANELDSTLYTADRKLVEKVNDTKLVASISGYS